MNDYLKKKLIDLVDSLISWPICQQFTGSNYDTLCSKFDILAVPESTNLNMVKSRLENNTYKNIDEFIKDVNEIWENGMKNKPADNLQKIMAAEASYWFNNKMKKFPVNETEEWIYKSAKFTKQLTELISFYPNGKEPTKEDVKKACIGLSKE